MESGIYKIENTVNGKVYIGSAVNFTRRFRVHKNSLTKGKHSNRHLQSSWNKYGEAKFTFVPILYCDKESLLSWEQIAIDGYKNLVSWQRMYNKYPTAGSALGARQTPESIAKRLATRISRGNLKHSDETKQLISKAHMGRKHTEKSKANYRSAHLGIPLSPEHAARIKEGQRRAYPEGINKGRIWATESIEKMKRSIAKRDPEGYARQAEKMRGRKLSQAHKNKIGAKSKGRLRSPESLAKGWVTRRANKDKGGA